MSSELLIMSSGASSYNLYGWGANGFNQFGYNSGSLSFSPLAALNASASIVQITGRGWATLALDTTGQVWAWGENYYGSVGNFTTNKTIVSPVVVLSNAVHIAANTASSAAVKSDGTVWVWGSTFNGLNGVSGTNYSSPVQLTTISGVSQVEFGPGTFSNYIFYRKTNGEVWSQGQNYNGVLGDGTTTFRSSPVQVLTLTGITKVQIGNDAGFALKSDGTIWGWGANFNGGNGTGSVRSAPAQIQYYSTYPTVGGNLVNIIDISANGTSNGFAIDSNYRLWGWGSGDIYQLGDQNYVPLNFNRSLAVLINQFYDQDGNLIAGGVSTTQVSSGNGSVLSVSSLGKLYSWGFNDLGQAGNSINGGLQTISKPTQIGTNTNWSKLASSIREAGDSGETTFQANYAITTSGAVYGTGVSRYYNFTRTNTVTSPIQVGSNGSVLATANGGAFGIAIGADKFLYTTGSNIFGQLGTTISYSGATPTATREKWWFTFLQIGTNKWKQIAAGGFSGYAIREDNTLWSWGYNSKGELGDGSVTTRSSPVQVVSTSLSSPVLISAGSQYALAVDNNGLVWSWGANQLGQLGLGSWSPGDYRISPVQVVNNSAGSPPLSNIVQISSAYTNSLALDSSGNIWAWGINGFGGMGVGIIGVSSPQPAAIESTLGQFILFGGESPVQIASGQYHSLALSSDGTVWSVGYNAFGQLGDLTITNRSAAVQISGLSNIVAVGANLYSSYAIANDGKLWVWGRNTGYLSPSMNIPDLYIGYLGTANNSVDAYSSPVLVGTYPRAESFSFSGSSNAGYQTMLVKPY